MLIIYPLCQISNKYDVGVRHSRSCVLTKHDAIDCSALVLRIYIICRT